ncbi:MAG: hypothetical protein E7016_07120 [Alphaproteobacteria bacterium]|nr:hypothetical protein [Alphaproteobacteria bacterium]
MSKFKTFLSFVLKIIVLFFIILSIVNIKNVYNFIMADGLFIMANPNFGKSEYVIKFIYVPFKMLFLIIDMIVAYFYLKRVSKINPIKYEFCFLLIYYVLGIINLCITEFVILYSTQNQADYYNLVMELVKNG